MAAERNPVNDVLYDELKLSRGHSLKDFEELEKNIIKWDPSNNTLHILEDLDFARYKHQQNTPDADKNICPFCLSQFKNEKFLNVHFNKFHQNEWKSLIGEYSIGHTNQTLEAVSPSFINICNSDTVPLFYPSEGMNKDSTNDFQGIKQEKLSSPVFNSNREEMDVVTIKVEEDFTTEKLTSPTPSEKSRSSVVRNGKEICIVEEPEEPHQVCLHCRCRFRNSADLSMHINVAHLRKIRSKPPPILSSDKNGYISCQECTFITKALSAINRHIQSEHPKRQKKSLLEITSLIKNKNKIVELDQHPPVPHFKDNTAKLTCGNCKLIIDPPDEFKLQKHIYTSHSRKEHNCKVCTYTSYTAEMLKTHMIRKHPDQSYVCQHCGFKSNNARGLRNHEGSLHPHLIRRFECGVCDFGAPTAVKLKDHLVMKHANIMLFSCKLCQFRTVSLKNYHRHIFMCCKKGGNIRCILCNLQFNNIILFRSHLNKLHPASV